MRALPVVRNRGAHRRTRPTTPSTVARVRRACANDGCPSSSRSRSASEPSKSCWLCLRVARSSSAVGGTSWPVHHGASAACAWPRKRGSPSVRAASRALRATGTAISRSRGFDRSAARIRFNCASAGSPFSGSRSRTAASSCGTNGLAHAAAARKVTAAANARGRQFTIDISMMTVRSGVRFGCGPRSIPSAVRRMSSPERFL